MLLLMIEEWMMLWLMWMLDVLIGRRQGSARLRSQAAAPAGLVLRGVILLAAFLTQGVALAADSFRDLQIAYRCEVVRRLEQIAAHGNPNVVRNRYIAVSVARRPENYVQCMFHDANTMVYCEAASGFYLTKPDQPRTFRAPPATIAALAQLGFDTDDSTGNFKIDRPVGAPPDFNALADLILRALHDGYGVRADTTLEFNAPFAPETPTSCVPMS